MSRVPEHWRRRGRPQPHPPEREACPPRRDVVLTTATGPVRVRLVGRAAIRILAGTEAEGGGGD